MISVVLICGAFAAASALQMRFDRVHALNQAAISRARRANDIAAVVASNLDRIEAQGRAFAADPLAKHAPAASAISPSTMAPGFATATLTGTTAFVRIPRDVLHAARTQKILIGGDGVATVVAPHGADVIAVAFDTHRWRRRRSSTRRDHNEQRHAAAWAHASGRHHPGAR